ncbi:beta strand repeat-containing protein [Pedobacter sp. KLB.chiD]|uniref:beta strand repeat-containing protein n=1 Tax=Pedobacter sp. KLB.chiD TaxID=3387402 RepID=UPI00399A75CB
MKIKYLILTICFALVLGITESFAQAPQQFNYQGAARNANGTPLANRPIALRISILDGSASGNSQYSETRSVTTNSLGLYQIAIGSPGAISTTGTISGVTWANGLKYIKVEVDPNNGSAFAVAGTAQLLSVPYAIYAATGGSAGSSILNGNTPPGAGTGNNGDFYIDATTNLIYGPKSNGTWPAGKSLVGPQGPAGPTGANGKSISGVTVDANGNLTITYTDGTTTMASGNVKGPKGDTGAAGANGKGISNTVVNSDGTISVTYTDGSVFTTTGSVKGPKGDPGAAGTNGKGISNTVVNSDGTISITYTDGSVFTTTGSVKGPKGDPGVAGTNGKGISNTVVNSDGTISISYTDGSVFTTTGSVKGPKGDPGAAGTDGKGISNTVVNSDGTISITYTDGSVFTTTGSVKGPKGDTGAAGTDGKGISNTVVNSDGTISITYTDGTVFTTTGSVKGPKGDPGIAGANGQDGKGIVSTVNNNDGTYTFTYTDGSTFRTANLTGPAGPTGPAGANGRGISGATTNSNGSVTFTYSDGTTFTTVPTTNVLSQSGTSLTSTVNGVSSTTDLQTLINSGTTVSNALSGASLSTTVNGVTGAAVNLQSALAAATTVSNSLSGTNLTTTVNGVNATPVDLSPAINAATTNALSKSGTTLTSTVNGVPSATDLQSIITAGTTVSNTLTGTNLTTTVNGVTGAAVNLQAAINAGTSVSNTSTGNTLTTTVNGVTGTAVNLVNTNTTSLSGSNLTTTVNGVASASLDLSPAIGAATTNTLAATNGNLVSTVNGVASTPAVAVLTSADNGLTSNNGTVKLGGTLTVPTALTTDATNTLAIAGLQAGAGTDKVLTADGNGILKSVDMSVINGSSWKTSGNAGTDGTVNFLGTTDTQPLKFRANNQPSGYLNSEKSNTFLGYQAGLNAPEVTENLTQGPRLTGNSIAWRVNKSVAIGYKALTSMNSNVAGMTAIGAYALANTQTSPTGLADGSTAIGFRALNRNTTGWRNTAIGFNALGNTTNGNGNIAIGHSAAADFIDGDGISVNDNLVIGNHIFLAQNNITQFDNNIVLGNNALTNSTFNGAVLNKLVIGNLTSAGIPLLLGDFSTRVLTINNTLKVSDLASTATATTGNRPVVADANGQLMIGTASAPGWSLNGNAGTDGTVNFLGTTDVQPLKFRVNNQQSGFLNSLNSNTFLGYQSGLTFSGVNDATSTLTNPRISGAPALMTNKTVGIGYKALANVQLPVQSVAIGAFALGTVDNPYRLTAIGYRSQYYMTGNSPGNTSVGYNTLANNPGGNGNTAIGSGALSDGTDAVGIQVNGNVVLGTTQIFPNATAFDRNIIIGNNFHTAFTGSLTDRLLIGNSPAGNGAPNAIIDGDLANKVLTINNTLKVSDLASTATATTGNRPVVADANGQLMIGTVATTSTSAIVVINADYTVLAADRTIIADATTAGLTITLPAASANTGRELIIRKADETTHVLTFSQSLKYSVTTNITTVNSLSTLHLQSDGTNWWVISKGL